MHSHGRGLAYAVHEFFRDDMVVADHRASVGVADDGRATARSLAVDSYEKLTKLVRDFGPEAVTTIVHDEELVRRLEAALAKGEVGPAAVTAVGAVLAGLDLPSSTVGHAVMSAVIRVRSMRFDTLG